jgi:hypothetical protein
MLTSWQRQDAIVLGDGYLTQHTHTDIHFTDIMIISEKRLLMDRFYFDWIIFLVQRFLGAKRNLEEKYRLRPTRRITCKNVGRVKASKFFAKWGNTDEKLLNEVICVKNIKLGDKNWNLLDIYRTMAISVSNASATKRCVLSPKLGISLVCVPPRHNRAGAKTSLIHKWICSCS